MSKIKTYLLLTGVLLIWGIIGYKIIDGVNPDIPELKHEDFNASFSPMKSKDIDTFSIKTLPRDPFLGTLTRNNNKKAKKSSTSLKQENLKTIIYKGLVKKQNSSDQVFVIRIDNSEYLLKKGQSADNIKLVSGDTKSIKVIQNNAYQTIKRQ